MPRDQILDNVGTKQAARPRLRGGQCVAHEVMERDVLVIGAGIAGLQAALDLADRGYSVLLVEREPSIGGKMIALSKVFPTMDCASCITTPRMSAWQPCGRCAGTWWSASCE